ncbi:phage tail terminator protein [Paracraurococcus ruber]|uniref:Uncharacterized protein n=1 Tax=Paracraurococcus ruber TaxID=77675 RepID=A0ABS1CQZ1_9PROT|nr:hypothetical protein [Paracraurococcus ruber]MBK1656845.1 hypothetical protein [Paracraurococcus ruber]TDG33960.1 hypothetical protein E2C05_01590 [Paracraurococcus ruber]
MRPSAVIPRLKAQCPIFSGRVAGAIDYKRAIQADEFPVPHAFVLLAGITPDGDDQLSSLDQGMQVQLSVVIAVSTAADDRGQDASERFMDCFVQVRDALLGWTPDPAFGPILMDGMTLSEGETFTRARAWAQIDITAAAMVRDLA